MHIIKVLGSGCKKCQVTTKLLTKAVAELGADAEIRVEKEEDFARIMAYGIMSTPGVVIDERVVHSGSVPNRRLIKRWLSELTPG